MAIHRAIPVHRHFSILRHRARHKLISGPQIPPRRLATSLNTELKLFFWADPTPTYPSIQPCAVLYVTSITGPGQPCV